MTKVLLQSIQVEYEQTSITIEEIKRKYSCTTKDLKGYTKWEKLPQDSLDSSIKLIYNSLYTPQSSNEWVVTPLYSPDPEDYLEESTETIEAELVDTANEIKQQKPVSKDSLPAQVVDGFEGLRRLDTKLQTQALTLLTTIDQQLHNIESAKDVRDLVASHTAIRDSYFNTKAPMINIMNGDVTNNNSTGLAELLDGTNDDC